MVETLVPIEILAGVQPPPDSTALSTRHYTASDKVRFRDGFPEKIGGWQEFTIANSEQIQGATRSIFSYNLSRNVRYLIGTNEKLYYLIGSTLTNITPLNTSFTVIANSLDSNFGTLGANPINTVNESTTVTIDDTATIVRTGDTIELSGVPGAVNGIPAAELNTTHFVNSQSTNSFTFVVSTAATSTGSGGGGAVVLATPIITVNATSHGQLDGDRVSIQNATAFAGIPAGDINIEHILRNAQTNTFDIVVDTIATSSVSGGGGANTEYAVEIDDGLCDAQAAFGYGAGLYGIGLYGVSKISSAGLLPARSWVFDRFGDLVVTTPGDQTNLYSWDSDISAAPAIVANAPTAINYVFVTNNIAVTLGAGGVVNRVQWCDQGNLTTWTAAATNQAGQDDIEGASEFLSHAPAKSTNLLFTESQVYSFRYIGRPFIFETQLLDDKSGIIGKNARITHNGVVYWMGNDNFYFYRSGNVEVIPSNTTNETTLKRTVFDDINVGQSSKIFAWFNRLFNEVWWHYPSSGSNEPNRVVRFNVKDFTWTPDTFDRSAAEYPSVLQQFPYLAETTNDSMGNCDTTLFEHEKGTDANGVSLPFTLISNFIGTGTNEATINAIVPDSTQVGDLTVTLTTRQYPQSVIFNNKNYTVTPTTEIIDNRAEGRYLQYTVAGNVLGQSWRAGVWSQLVQSSGRR